MTDAPSHKKLRRRPKRVKRPRVPKLTGENTLAIVHRLLLALVRTSLNGKQVKITALEAIMYQLLRSEADGDARASAVLLKYKELARRDGGKRLNIVFVGSDNSQFLSHDQPGGDDG